MTALVGVLVAPLLLIWMVGAGFRALRQVAG